MPSYFYPLQINSSIQNFLINHLILIHLIYFHDFMIFFLPSPIFTFSCVFFSSLPIIPLIYSIWFFLLPIQLFSSHLFLFLPLFSLSPTFFSFSYYSSPHLFQFIFSTPHSIILLTYSYCIYSTSSSSHHFIRLTLSLSLSPSRRDVARISR